MLELIIYNLPLVCLKILYVTEVQHKYVFGRRENKIRKFLYYKFRGIFNI